MLDYFLELPKHTTQAKKRTSTSWWLLLCTDILDWRSGLLCKMAGYLCEHQSWKTLHRRDHLHGQQAQQPLAANITALRYLETALANKMFASEIAWLQLLDYKLGLDAQPLDWLVAICLWQHLLAFVL